MRTYRGHVLRAFYSKGATITICLFKTQKVDRRVRKFYGKKKKKRRLQVCFDWRLLTQDINFSRILVSSAIDHRVIVQFLFRLVFPS